MHAWNKYGIKLAIHRIDCNVTKQRDCNIEREWGGGEESKIKEYTHINQKNQIESTDIIWN